MVYLHLCLGTLGIKKVELGYHMLLPTEAHLPTERFEPNHVRAILQKMYADLLPPWMDHPATNQDEAGIIYVGNCPLQYNRPVFVIYKHSGEWKVTNNVSGETTSHPDPFNAIKEVVKYYAGLFVEEWVFYFYTCAS